MIVIAVRLLEGMFAAGAIGCVVVLVLSVIEDVKVLFDLDDDSHASRPQDPRKPRVAESTPAHI